MKRERTGKVALFDMDTSLFDFESSMISHLQAMASPGEPDITSCLWDLDEIPYMKARMDAIKSIPGWWRSLKPIQAGFEVWEMARRIGYDMQILTKGPWSHPVAWTEKVQCCQHHLGNDIDIQIVTTNKGGIYGYFLYDDYPAFMDAWLANRPRGWGIMPETPSNENYTHPRVIKFDGYNFNEVEDKLRELFVRKDNHEA